MAVHGARQLELEQQNFEDRRSTQQVIARLTTRKAEILDTDGMSRKS
eukprot:SAG31_NODE_3901_length_3770_cov_4.494416_5_plen_47_part_00